MSSTSPSAGSDDGNIAAALDQLRELGGDSFVAAIAASFAQQAESFFAGAPTADMPALRRGAHKLRGISAQLHAERLRAVCEELEAAAERGDEATARHLIDAGEAAFAAIRGRLVST